VKALFIEGQDAALASFMRQLFNKRLRQNYSLLHVHATFRVHPCATTLDLHVHALCGETSPVWPQDADFFGTEKYQLKMKHANSGLKGCTESV